METAWFHGSITLVTDGAVAPRAVTSRLVSPPEGLAWLGEFYTIRSDGALGTIGLAASTVGGTFPEGRALCPTSGGKMPLQDDYDRAVLDALRDVRLHLAAMLQVSDEATAQRVTFVLDRLDAVIASYATYLGEPPF